MTDQPPAGVRRHRFMGESIDLADTLTEAQLDGRACVHCSDEHSTKRPVEVWSEQSAQLFEYIDREACDRRRHEGFIGGLNVDRASASR